MIGIPPLSISSELKTCSIVLEKKIIFKNNEPVEAGLERSQFLRIFYAGQSNSVKR